MNDLYLLAVNLTRRCNLVCAHCYMDAGTREQGGKDELTTLETQDLLDQVASRGDETMVVLTGGEPLMRRDLEALVAHGNAKGLSMVVGSNGVMLTEERVKSLKAAGAMGLGISLDSLDPDRHDRFRGCPGSWEKTLAGMDACRHHELPFQVHFSVTNDNAGEIASMIQFARDVGARVLNVFFLICTGRGESMSDIAPERYEQVLQELVMAQEQSTDLIIRARCAPHFKRVAYQRNPASPLTRAEGYEGGGCLAGIHYCRVTPEGGITACPYLPEEQGSIRTRPFWDIWNQSPVFAQLRDPELGGKCGECEFRVLCGGCRARPKALGGGLMDADPWCVYEPGGGAEIQPLAALQSEIEWLPEAEQRLSRVPAFLRKMVKKRAEDHAREQGQNVVTPEHLSTLAARRFPGASGGPVRSGKDAPPIVWTQGAAGYLEEIPAFMRDGVKEVAESVAREEGHLEVNMKLIGRLEEDDTGERKRSWDPEAERALEQALADRPPQVRMFVLPTMEAAAEREAKRRKSATVSVEDVQCVVDTQSAGVEWDPQTLRRVESAPEFIRAGIKKAAEFNARREGLAVITDDDLTRFRNRAMMRAVRRMKGFGMRELSFDAFEIARERVPRLKDNAQAARRFSNIKSYVSEHQQPGDGGLGLMDREFIDKMKAELKANKPKKKRGSV
ncbi:MAG: putative mycofactocin radical SAM maturase MftC [Gammaproteobacteria bacterium]|nr:putative mycofactocin radical SAM maturase MftC [Gammaproteobacteria bacterium]